MAKKVWTFMLEDGTHTVELAHGYWSGKRTIRVDGKLLQHTAKVGHAVMDFGSDHPFSIGSHRGSVRIQTNGLTYRYDLVLDGRSIVTGRPAAGSAKLPPWAWAFILACGVIPILTLGGAIPGAIGAGGVVGCISIARNSARPTISRVMLCAGVTVLCWALLITFFVVAGRLSLRA